MSECVVEYFVHALKRLGFEVFNASVNYKGEFVELWAEPEDFLAIVKYTGTVHDVIFKHSFKLGPERRTVFNAFIMPNVILTTVIKEKIQGDE